MENKLNKNNILKLLNVGDEIKDDKYWEQHRQVTIFQQLNQLLQQ